MPHYFVRVELHDADDDSYNLLHSEMEDLGFKRELEIVQKKLPDGTYILPNYQDLPARAITRLARQAVEAIEKKASYVAVKFNNKEDISVLSLEDI